VDELEEQLRDLDKAESMISLSSETRKYSKPVTIIKGIQLSNSEVRPFLHELKTKLATGGTWKDNQIILQGDKRDEARAFLISKGYRVN
jgi:translation initiation factor 1